MGINVLSLFDGISCGMVALERAGIQVDNYYASEIDKYATQISQKNYPDIIRLGDINNWQEWKLPKIDLIMGGSPCQGFSNAGMGLNFEDPRSKLFFVFVDILKFYQPEYFLLENVKMKQEWQNIISDLVGVKPIEINSSLVSAQNRKRLYWTNIANVQIPEDKHIYLKDIIFPDADIPCLHNIYGGFKEVEPRTFFEKSPTIRTSAGGGHIPSIVDINKVNGAATRNQITNHGVEFQLNMRNDGKSNCVVPSYTERLNLLVHTEKAIEYMNREVADGRTHWDFDHHSDVKNEKSSCITANTYKGIPYNVLVTEKLIRKFHPIECERLQTLPDNYTEGVSDSQRYKGIGNGWTVDVIAHILSNMKY